MSKHRPLRRSDLFLLRLWSEAGGDGGHGRSIWRGKVQRVIDGESRRFSDWEDLLAILDAMLSEERDDGQKTITEQENSTRAEEGTKNG
jgi:hypothetical protein